MEIIEFLNNVRKERGKDLQLEPLVSQTRFERMFELFWKKTSFCLKMLLFSQNLLIKAS